MTAEVLRASIEHKPVLRNLLQLYHHDFSEWTGEDVTEHGEFTHLYLDHYWTDPDSHPFLIRRAGKWAGFVLVRTLDINDVGEFFILRKYRRAGVGREAAHRTFARFPGEWQVRQLRTNPTATTFWRSVLPPDHVETTTDTEIIQHFTIATTTPRP